MDENNKTSIVEVETKDSINDSHTKDQWQLFSMHAFDIGTDFNILVPKGSENDAEKRKKELGILGVVTGI